MEQILGVEKRGWSAAHILCVAGLYCSLEDILGVEERHCSEEHFFVLGQCSLEHILGFEECLCSHCVLDEAYVWSLRSALRSLELLQDQ